MLKRYVLLLAVALSFPSLADTTEEKINLAMSAAPAGTVTLAGTAATGALLLTIGTTTLVFAGDERVTVARSAAPASTALVSGSNVRVADWADHPTVSSKVPTARRAA